MLRHVPGRSSDRRRGHGSTKGDQRGTRTTSNPLHVPAGRPIIYEPQRVGTERIRLEELEGLLQIEAEASGIGIGNRGWKQVYESEGSVLEQWEPGPDDAESELVFFRAMLTLEGVPLSIALSQMTDPAERQQWDSSIESLRRVPTVKARTNSDDVQSDVVHFKTTSFLGMFPVGECIMWRSLMKREGGSLAAVLLRNAEVDVATGEINKDPENIWASMLSPLRVRKLVYGHVFRSLDKTDEMKGSRVFTYVQVKANTALQYAAPHLAVSLATQNRDDYRKACQNALAALQTTVTNSTSDDLPQIEDAEFYDISSQCNEDDASEQSGWDFLGGVLGKLGPQDRQTRKSHRASLREARKRSSTSSLQAPLRVVQLHRAATVDLSSTPGNPFEELQDVQPKFTTDISERRSRLRERRRASQHDSMAEVSKRLSTVMHERGNVQFEEESGNSTTERHDSMAWLSGLVDLGMGLRLGSAPSNPMPVLDQPGRLDVGEVVDGDEAQPKSAFSDASGDQLHASATEQSKAASEVETVSAVEAIQPASLHELDPQCHLRAETCSQQVAPFSEHVDHHHHHHPAADAAHIEVDCRVDGPEHQLSTSDEAAAGQNCDNPTSVMSSGSATMLPSSAAPRKKFMLPKMSRRSMPKIGEQDTPWSADVSDPAFSGGSSLVTGPPAQQRQTSPSPSSSSSPHSSRHNTCTAECGMTLSEELAVAEQTDKKCLAPSPEVGKLMQPTADDLEIDQKKILTELPGKQVPPCENVSPLYVSGLEPEPGPEPGPDSPCLQSLRPQPNEGIASAHLVDMAAVGGQSNGDAGEGRNSRNGRASMQGLQSLGTRCSIRPQLGGGTCASARSEDIAVAPASDALLFSSVKKVTTVAKALKKMRSKTKSEDEHRRSQHLR